MSQPFACDGRVDAEKLSELLAVQTETEALDYKLYIDLTHTEDRVEFAKDVGAMQSLDEGGYIVVGVDSHGVPTKAVGTIDAKTFDEQKVRGALRKYLHEPFVIRSHTHEIDSIPVALIYIGRNEQGFAIFAQDGQYVDSKNKKNTTAFRKGDVYCRHGSSSEPWSQADLPRIFHSLRTIIREEERKRIGDALREIEQGTRGAEIQQGPIGSLSWQLASSDFESAILAAIRVDDRVPLRTAILSSIATAESFIHTGKPDNDDLWILLDRLTTILGLAITHEHRWLFDRIVDALSKIYWSAADDYGYPLNDLAINPAKLWLEIGSRIEAAGALALRMQELWAIRPLVLPELRKGEKPASWLRHSVASAANADLLVGNSGRPVAGAFIGFSRQAAARIAALRPDIPDSLLNSFEVGVTPQPQDPLLDSIVQFDLIWCVIAYQHTHKNIDFYPNFSGYYAHRAAPAARQLLTRSAREKLLPSVSDDELRTALKTVFEGAERESWRIRMGGWDLNIPELTAFFQSSTK